MDLIASKNQCEVNKVIICTSKYHETISIVYDTFCDATFRGETNSKS